MYVTVIVKLKNHKEPYTYTRTYIPEIKLLSLSNAKTAVDKLTQYIEHVKKDTKPSSEQGTKLLEMQLEHMKSFFAYMKPDYKTAIEGVTYFANDNVLKMFDGNLNTSWESSITARVDGEQWVVNFKTNRPITPKKYTIYTDAKWEKHDEANPTLWHIHGKDDKGNWHTIDYRNAEPGSTKDHGVGSCDHFTR